MQLQNIYTDRHFQEWPSWHLIYEWEDVFANELNLKLTDSREAFIISKFTDRIIASLSRRLKIKNDKLLKIADKLISKETSLYFEMFPLASFRFSTSKNTIPFIIDFWKTENIDTFYKAYENSKMVFISSKEAYGYLKKNKCPLNIHHIPLSIADKYKIQFTNNPKKKYDIILAGRTSPVFYDYLREFEKKHPDIEYIHSKHIDNKLYYVSNKGAVIGNFHNREDYFNLLRSSKVAFYSTPGIDGREDRTGGFNPVTPRLFELAAAGCSIIARYPENADTDFYRLKLFFPSVDNYSMFEKQLINGLNGDADLIQKQNAEFLKDHYTSKRVQLINQILNG